MLCGPFFSSLPNCVNPVNLNNDLLYPYKEGLNRNRLFIKCNSENGKLKDKESVSNIFYWEDEVKMDKNGNLYLFGLIDETFEGMNSERLASDKRSSGKEDFYIAKIYSDCNLIWDYTMGGADSEGVSSYLYPGINGDTLYLKIEFASDSLNINPNGAESVYVKPIQGIRNPCIFAKYQLSENELPQLLNYKSGSFYDFPIYMNVNKNSKLACSKHNPDRKHGG